MIQVDPFPIESFNEIVRKLEEPDRARQFSDIEEDVVLEENYPPAQPAQAITAAQVAGAVCNTTAKQVDYIDLTNGRVDGHRVEYIMAMLLKRAQMSKSQLARIMKVQRASLQPYYRAQRKNGINIKFLIKMIQATGGRLLVELPENPDA